MGKKKGMKMFGIFGWVLSIFILLALISIGTMAFFDYNLLLAIAFNNDIGYKIIAGVVSIFGLFALVSLLISSIMRK